jgi:hypothetical protein
MNRKTTKVNLNSFIECLIVVGYTRKDIAELLGTTQEYIRLLQTGKRQLLAKKIKEVVTYTLQRKRQQTKTKTTINSKELGTQNNKKQGVLTPLTVVGVISEMSFISLCDRCKKKDRCKFYDKVICLRNKELQKEDNNLQLYTYCCPDYEEDVEFYKKNKDVLAYLNKVARRV